MGQSHAGTVNKICAVGFIGPDHGIDVTGVDASCRQKRLRGFLYNLLPVRAADIQQDIFFPQDGADARRGQPELVGRTQLFLISFDIHEKLLQPEDILILQHRGHLYPQIFRFLQGDGGYDHIKVIIFHDIRQPVIGGNRHDADVEIGIQPFGQKVGCAYSCMAYDDHLWKDIVFEMPFHCHHEVD